MSGGLGSSALTALAQRSPDAGGGGRVRAFSVDFSGLAENFRPEPFREAPDASTPRSPRRPTPTPGTRSTRFR
ncbi:asparagine synthase-related protein [Streptomyces rubradiris]